MALFGPLHPSTYRELPRLLYFFAKRSADPFLREMAKLPTFGARLRYFGSRLRNLGERVRALLTHVRENKESVTADPVLASRARLKSTAITALRRYSPPRIRAEYAYSFRTRPGCDRGQRRTDGFGSRPMPNFISGPRTATVPLCWRNRTHLPSPSFIARQPKRLND